MRIPPIPADWTDKMRIFCYDYIDNGQNARLAAIKAGYKETFALEQARRLLKRQDVRVWLATALQPVIDKAVLSQEKLLERMTAAALANPNDMFRADGSLKNVSELPEELGYLIAGVDVGEDGMPTKIKMMDQKAVWNQLAQHLNMYKEHEKNSGSINITIEKEDIGL